MQEMPHGVWEQLAARVHVVSSRPRMALLTALLLLERADEDGVIQTSRAELGHALRLVAGDRGYVDRRQARRERIAPLLEERRTVEAKMHEALHKAPRGMARVLVAGAFGAVLTDIDTAIGNPTGQNLSRVMTELEKAGVLAYRGYIDRDGELYDKPARGRIYYLQLADWLRPEKDAAE